MCAQRLRFLSNSCLWNPACIHGLTGLSFMGTTTIEINPEAVAVERYQRKVQELTDIIKNHMLKFRRIARRHLRNPADAEDAVQDALLSALTHVDQFKGQAKMSTWLTTIIINSARMQLRRRLRQVQLSLDETDGEQNTSLADMVSDTRPDPEQLYCNREIAETIARATSRLSPTLRRTFQLRAVEGLSIREAAQILGAPTGTVKAQLTRARMRLKQTVKKSFRESGMR